MQIAGLQKTSTVDYPGLLAAVLFTAGCNLNCFYCHNRALLFSPPLLSEAEVQAFLQKRAGLLDGVVFSGGEPTLQKDLAWWMNYAKKLGYSVKLDTNGRCPEALSSLLAAGLVDFVALDVKAPPHLYPALCGAGADGVKRSIALLSASGVPHEFRTTLAPQLGAKELMEIAALLPEDASWALQYYRVQPGNEALLLEAALRPYTPAEVAQWAGILKKLRPGVFARS